MVKKIIIFFLVTRILVFLFPWVINVYSRSEQYQLTFFQYLINSWNFWDAPHFLYISQHWYTNIGDPANFIVFLPFYPLLVANILLIINSPVIAGMLVSTICSLLAVIIFHQLVIKINKYKDPKIPIRATLFLLIFPTSYFLTAPYSESTFLLLWSISFLTAFQKKWATAGITAALASLTRNFGFLIFPALICQWYFTKKRRLGDAINIVLPGIIALLLYLLINLQIYNDPFAFQKILSQHWYKTISFPITTFINVWKIALSKPLNNYSITLGWYEGVALMMLAILIPFTYKKLPIGLFVYHLLSFLLVTSTSFVLSTPRYILSIPTTFIILAILIRHKIIQFIYISFSLGGLIYFTYLYTTGQWAF